jgi:transposase
VSGATGTERQPDRLYHR